MSSSSQERSSQPRNLTKIKFLQQAHTRSNAANSAPATRYEPPAYAMEEMYSAQDEPSQESSTSNLPPQFRHSIFQRPHEFSVSSKASTDRSSMDYFDLKPTYSEAGSRPETPFDVNLEDPKQGLLFLKPPVPKRERSGAEALKRRTRAMSIAYIEYATSAVKSLKTRNQPTTVSVPDQKYQKVSRAKESWYSNWSTRRIILLSASTIIMLLLATGLIVGLIQRGKRSHSQEFMRWRPAIGSTWQIQLNEPVTNPSYRAYIWDIDFFDNNASTIEKFHSMGRRVICHFSAGTYETWQSDEAQFPAQVLGNSVIGWGIERWLDIRQESVRKIMADRIAQAQGKGCDGISPDNINGYTVDTSFNLTESDSVKYIRYLAGLAHSADLAIGLINAPELIGDTLDVVDFGMNEGCAQENNCSAYRPFIQAGKPVLHIEYATGAISQSLSQACNAEGTLGFSTLVKKARLDEWALECPLVSS